MAASMPDRDVHTRAWAAFTGCAAQRLASFERALEAPAVAQAAVFRETIACGANSAFGREYGFAEITTTDEYQQRVPVCRPVDFAPWIERAKSESGSVLTAESPAHFERTSGSTAQARDIPYTPALMVQFQRALIAWLAKLYQCCPDVAGPAWWSMSPERGAPTKAANGIPIGSASDAVYLHGCEAQALLGTLIDTRVSSAADDWKTEALARIVACRDLALISVWSPTFLGALLGIVIDDNKRVAGLQRMKTLLSEDRYRLLLRAIDAQDFSLLWPKLRVLSAWTDGPSERYAANLDRLFSGARMVPKGLFATEGVVSISWGLDAARPLAIESHFLEFLDHENRPRLAEELVAGERYEPLLTTAGGLYRYALGDLVEVTGFLGATPTVRFVGRVDARCDLVGEKLDEGLVAAAFDAVGLTQSAVLLPVAEASLPHYRLVVEAIALNEADALGRSVDEALCDCYHYGLARQNGQLDSVTVSSEPSLSALLHASWEALDRRSGDAKPASLISSATFAREILLRCDARGGAV